MGQRFQIGHDSINASDSGFESALAAAYAHRERPLCLCRDSGVAMYIAAVGDRHIVKRMPNTGSDHSPDCASFEPPPELSGYGEVAGTAIMEDTSTGAIALKLNFALSKSCSRTASTAKSGEAATVKSDGHKLTLRSLLHYLWEESALNVWSPAMENKRSWFVVRRELLCAAASKSVKGQALEGKLFIPESFSVDHSLEIERKRMATLSQLYSPGRQQELMLLIGEVKSIDPARMGFNVVIKHLPDLRFHLDEQTKRRMEKRFFDELALWCSDESTHLVIAATFGVGPAGLMAINEMALMVTSATWLPIESSHDQQLVMDLVRSRRRFRRCLRYNMALSKPVAVALLTDTQPQPVAMYAIPPDYGADAGYMQSLQTLVEASSFPSWFWHAGREAFPELPALNGFASMELGAAHEPAEAK